MQVILIENVKGLGKVNDLIEVKGGYGRNFLLPNRLALMANKSNKKIAAEIVSQAQRREQKVLSQFEGLVKKLGERTIKVGAKVGTTGKIFGSVTNVQLADAIKKSTGEEVDRRKITILSDEVKALGAYQAQLVLHPKVKVDFNFEVISE